MVPDKFDPRTSMYFAAIHSLLALSGRVISP
jgi:hypothetical protein